MFHKWVNGDGKQEASLQSGWTDNRTAENLMRSDNNTNEEIQTYYPILPFPLYRMLT